MNSLIFSVQALKKPSMTHLKDKNKGTAMNGVPLSFTLFTPRY
ncbi:hypothetical protein [Xenorhabdus kozodoii]|nr:hypothetical protein [Xenorhabdus kozodoii]